MLNAINDIFRENNLKQIMFCNMCFMQGISSTLQITRVLIFAYFQWQKYISWDKTSLHVCKCNSEIIQKPDSNTCKDSGGGGQGADDLLLHVLQHVPGGGEGELHLLTLWGKHKKNNKKECLFLKPLTKNILCTSTFEYDLITTLCPKVSLKNSK